MKNSHSLRDRERTYPVLTFFDSLTHFALLLVVSSGGAYVLWRLLALMLPTLPSQMLAWAGKVIPF